MKDRQSFYNGQRINLFFDKDYSDKFSNFFASNFDNKFSSYVTLFYSNCIAGDSICYYMDLENEFLSNIFSNINLLENGDLVSLPKL